MQAVHRWMRCIKINWIYLLLWIIHSALVTSFLNKVKPTVLQCLNSGMYYFNKKKKKTLKHSLKQVGFNKLLRKQLRELPLLREPETQMLEVTAAQQKPWSSKSSPYKRGSWSNMGYFSCSQTSDVNIERVGEMNQA